MSEIMVLRSHRNSVAWAIGPSVNTTMIIFSSVNKTLMIDPNFEIFILNFKLIFHDKYDSKFNISPTLGLRVKKSPPKIPTYQGLSSITKRLPQFFFNYFILFYCVFQ
jgi:hypothetical protein